MSTKALVCASKQAGALPFLEYVHTMLGNALPYREMMTEAAANGHVESLEWFLGKNIPWNPSILTDAAAGGHLHVLQWTQEKKLELPSSSSMPPAALSGNLEILQWVKDNNFELRKFFSWAARGGHVHVLDWLSAEGLKPEAWEVRKSYIQAAKGGHVEVFRWMEARTGWGMRGMQAKEIYIQLAAKGWTDVLRWMREKGHLKRNELLEVCQEGARRGEAEVVKWGWEEVEVEGGMWANGEVEGLVLASLDGRSLETLEWIYRRSEFRSNEELYFSVIISSRRKGGSKISEIFEFLEKNGCPLKLDDFIWGAAIRLEILDALDWFASRGPPLPSLWTIAIQTNRPLSLWWLKKKGCPRDDQRDLFLSAHSVTLLEWLKKEGGFLPQGGPMLGVGKTDQAVWWLVREGYKVTREMMKEWVRWERWEMVRRAIQEGYEWDEEIYGKLREREEMREWVEENWEGKN
jgi:hypothetical protein